MAFRVGAYAKIWDLKQGKNGSYYVAEMSTSKKLQDGSYEQDWANKFVMLSGDATKIADSFQRGMTVRIGDCAVTNRWDKEKSIMYTNYAIYSFQTDDGSQKTRSSGGSRQQKTDKAQDRSFMEVPAGDSEELPFN